MPSPPLQPKEAVRARHCYFLVASAVAERSVISCKGKAYQEHVMEQQELIGSQIRLEEGTAGLFQVPLWKGASLVVGGKTSYKSFTFFKEL